MKTSAVFDAIGIARVNAPTWEIYTFDNQVLGDQVALDVLANEDESLKEYYEVLPLNGCYLFAWFNNVVSAKEFGEWIKDAISKDENSDFYSNFTIIDSNAMYRGEGYYLQIIQIDHEI